jgi:hypothetical protein
VDVKVEEESWDFALLKPSCKATDVQLSWMLLVFMTAFYALQTYSFIRGTRRVATIFTMILEIT